MKVVVPETSDLQRVYHVLRAVQSGESPHEATGLSSRQVSYAIQAALAFKLLQRTNELLALTDLGEQLVQATWGSEETRLVLRGAIERMPLFELFPDLLSPSLDAAEFANRLQTNPKTALSATTARKRASSIAQWRRQVTPQQSVGVSPKSVVLVVQLSDIHFVADESQNPIMPRATAIGRGLAAHFDMWDLAGCIFAITGDIAQTALAEEYAVAERFLADLEAAVSSALRCKVYRVIVPGNHDCALGGVTSVRDHLLSHLSMDQLDDQIFDTINQAQFTYRAFSERMESKDLEHRFNSRATSIETLNLGGHLIRFDKYNTAWCSKIKEQQGTLAFPIAELPTDIPDVDAVVALLHHPLAWIENVSARALRERLAGTADIVLTGHEHVSSRYTVINEASEHLEYCEGSVLQDRTDVAVSGFNAILLDFRDSTQRSYKFELAEGKYDATILPARAFKRAAARHRNAFTHSPTFESLLRDPGDAYAHPRKKAIELADIYVVPEAKPAFITGGTDKLEEASLALLLKEERLLILGQELTGKTALAKMLVAQLYDEGKTPLMLRGQDIRSADVEHLENLRAKTFSEQYDAAALERYLQLPREQRALVIDDAHRSPLRRAELHEALAILERGFGYCLVLADDEFPMSLLDASCQDDVGVLAFETFSLQPFGAKRRYRLVERWCYLGRSAASDDELLSRRAQQLDELLGRAMGSSLLPALPCLILLCLQQIDSTQSSQLSDGSFGHLYDALVTTNLSLGGKAKFDIGSKRTVLSRLAHHLYQAGQRDISDAEWRSLYQAYLTDYDASHPNGPFLDELLESNLITRSPDGRIAFKYKYSFCLFVAAFIVKTLQPEALRQEARGLCECLDKDDSANILLFVAHFAPDGPVADALLTYSQTLLPHVAEFDLHQRMLPLGNSDHIRNLSLDADTPEERRNLDRERRDKATRSSPDNSLKTDGLPEQLVQYVRALRAVHILGQVLRSTSGTLLAERKAELLGAAYGVSRRTVAAIVGMIVEEHGELSEDLAKLITQHRPELEGDLVSLREQLMRFLVSLCEGLVYNTVLLVSQSVGAASLRKTYDRVLSDNQDLLFTMFDLAIRLDHFDAFPAHELEAAIKLVGNKHSPASVLRLLVWRHLYLFPVEYRQRRRLCQQFDIKESALMTRRAFGRS